MKSAKEQGDTEVFESYDLRFHLSIAEASGNQVLQKMVESIRQLMMEQLKVILKVPGRIESLLKLHSQIYTTIAEGNSEKAGKLMNQHIKNAEQDYKKSHQSLSQR